MDEVSQKKKCWTCFSLCSPHQRLYKLLANRQQKQVSIEKKQGRCCFRMPVKYSFMLLYWILGIQMYTDEVFESYSTDSGMHLLIITEL